jgi:NTE family protein
MTPSTAPVTGLVLSGGGARAAYQLGVLQAIAELWREQAPPSAPQNPFPVIVGTSAGAINAAALACGADDFDATVASLAATWGAMHAAQIYRADAWGVARTGARWLSLFSVGWAFARWQRARPKSLLDNSPLAELLVRLVPLARLPMLMQAGHLQALAVTASDYTRGEHVTFYDTVGHCVPWTRSQRLALRSSISHAHLLASSAIPFVFPAVALPLAGRTQYFGDGSMRQVAPISPAVHLGAQRIMVIGAGRLQEPGMPRPVAGGYPSLAQIAGHALSSIFLDALAVDIECLHRINHMLTLLPPEARERTPLRPIDLLVISPSQRLDDIAARHLQALPAPVRAMLRATGVHRDTGAALPTAGGGAALASYLLFESDYTRELMALGAADLRARRAEVLAFFGWPDTEVQREAGASGGSG